MYSKKFEVYIDFEVLYYHVESGTPHVRKNYTKFPKENEHTEKKRRQLSSPKVMNTLICTKLQRRTAQS
jgi:hypothetical protein